MYGIQIATVGSGAAVSNWIDLRDYAHAGLVVPAVLDATSKIAFMVTDNPTLNPTGFPLYNETTGSDLVQIIPAVNAARAYQFPLNVYAWGWVQIWLQSAGTSVTQAAARVFEIFGKSVN